MNYKDCETCDDVFRDTMALDLHMQKKHKETEHEKHARKEKITKFITEKITQKRKKEDETEQVKENIKILSELKSHIDEEEAEDNEYYKIDTYPKDGSEDENANVTFKGTSTEFKDAVQIIKEMMSKPKSSFKVGGREVKVISALKTAPITVEVTTIKNEVGRAGLKFFASKTNTIVVTKQRGQSSKFSKALGMKIIKDMLEGLTSGKVIDASEYENNEIKREEKNHGSFKCDLCERIFQTKQGKSIHMTKGHKEKATSNNCLSCGKTFKLEKSLEYHIEICQGILSPSVETKHEESHCQKCGKKFDSNILLKEHIVSHQVFDDMIKKTPNPKKHKLEVVNTIEGEKKRKCENKIENGRKCDDCDLKFKEMPQIEWIKCVQKHKIKDCTERKPLSTQEKVCPESLSPPKKKRNVSFSPETDTIEIEEMDTIPDKTNEHVLVKEMKTLDIKSNEEENNVFEMKLLKKIDHTIKMKQKKKEAFEESMRKQEQEKEEMEKRSAFMDKKVQEIERKKDIEEQLSRKKKVEDDDEKKKEKDVEVAKENEAKKIRKATIKRVKKHKKKKTEMQANGYSEIATKYHTLVGKYIYQYHGIGDGACQSRAESKILFGNQHKGLQYAKVKNQYLIDHFSSFEDHIKFPHTIKVGSGKYEKFNNFKQFKEYLQNNPNSKLMWGDHVQLQITANMYNITTHLLVANGDGNVLTFSPDARLKKFAVLEEMEWRDEIWLIYINNNHYDALVAEDSACVTMNNKIVHEEIETDEEDDDSPETPKESNYEDVEIVKAAVEAIPLLGKWIAGPPKQHQHQVVQSEVTTETADDKLKKEIKEHNVTKNKLKAIQDGYAGCKVELRNVQEDKERLKIKVKDLETVKELTNTNINESIKRRGESEILNCVICEYPFKTQITLNSHIEKHKKTQFEIEVKQSCGICDTVIYSNDELKMHIKIKHTGRFNCNQCDFQCSTRMILTKHTNLKHRTEEDQEEGTLRCTECDEQFSDAWNLSNHIRDNHTKKISCKFFKEGRCKFLDNQCWNIHEKVVKRNLVSLKVDDKKTKCFNCDQVFKTMKGMMDHRSKEHPEKIPLCKNAKTCTFKLCWFRHVDKPANESESASNEDEDVQQWLDEELDDEKEDFQETQTKPKPPIKT